MCSKSNAAPEGEVIAECSEAALDEAEIQSQELGKAAMDHDGPEADSHNPTRVVRPR
jgi:hypothetical protein